ncbi:MAG: type II toxin-antitoxin system HicB family antitoxin [Fimbriimonas sp.]|nr:type II toxin-antitoxin system HicB family antitoxin [Fimbriimonas sp.]
MKYAILLEPQHEGGSTGTVPDLPGCVSQGETEAECHANIAEAIEGWIETAHRNGWPVPKPSFRSSVVEIRAA